MAHETLTSSLVDAVRHLAPSLAERAPSSEAHRRVDDRSIAEMTDAGLFRILTPTTHGGLEAGLGAQVETLFVVAAADPAAGWVQMVSNSHAFVVASFSRECREAVYGGPDVIPGTLSPQGRSRRVDDGWVVDGRWQFASGVDHGQWLMLGTMTERTATNDVPGVHVLVPMDGVIVDDTWHVLGLRGTGSKDVVAEELFVPDAFAVPTPTLFGGHSPHGEDHDTRLSRLSVTVSLSTQLAAAVVGIGDAAFDAYQERTRVRREIVGDFTKASRVGPQLRISESRAELDVARGLVRAAAERGDRVGATGDRLSRNERAELRFLAAYAVELVRRAVDRLYTASGAHGVYDDSLLQARYRDVNTACHHAMVDFDNLRENYGRVLLGLDPLPHLL